MSALKRIVIEVIPHDKQRYPTCGDYWVDADGTVQFRISKLRDWRRVSLIIIHELWEYFVVKHERIPLKAIDRFDMAYESHRVPGDESEPGDHPDCPYRDAHCSATGVERLLAAKLGVCWRDYDRDVTGL